MYLVWWGWQVKKVPPGVPQPFWDLHCTGVVEEGPPMCNPSSWALAWMGFWVKATPGRLGVDSEIVGTFPGRSRYFFHPPLVRSRVQNLPTRPYQP